MKCDYYLNMDLEDYPTEEWVDVKNFEGLYQISNFGRVKRLKTIIPVHQKNENIHHKKLEEQIVAQVESVSGFLKVFLKGVDRKPKTFFVHKLMGEHFLGEKPQYGKVKHVNRCKFNNSSNNLYWFVPRYRVQQLESESNYVQQEERIFV